MKPKSYREQNNCTMCKFVFVKPGVDYDEYFCNIDNDRPVPCGTWMLGEGLTGDVEDQYEKMNTWDKWAAENYVERYGICDEFIGNK
jgi:hypothetical protein